MFRVIFMVDMDAFFASVEQRDHPEWRGKPVIVGSPPTQRGVVCAASYEARAYGVRSAMPSMTAGRLCPDGIFVRPDKDRYKEESREIMSIMDATGAIVEKVSIDEAYMDVSAFFQGPTADDSLQMALPMARELKCSILTKRRLTASIGIASNKLMAKLASDHQKPNGLTLISDSSRVEFLKPLPVSVLYGVGKVTEASLNRAGIRTVGDLQNYGGDLRAIVGSFGPELKDYSFGIDHRPLDLSEEIKSVSTEKTFLQDTLDKKLLRSVLLEQADEIADELRQKALVAKTIQIRVRYGDFTTFTRQTTLSNPVGNASEIYTHACLLLKKHKLVVKPLRLLGLGVTNLGSPSSQLCLPL